MEITEIFISPQKCFPLGYHGVNVAESLSEENKTKFSLL